MLSLGFRKTSPGEPDSSLARRDGAVALRAESVSYSVGGKRLVDDVSYECRGGEVFGVVGPNGAGKTTLMQVAAGLLDATHGGARIFDRDISQLSVAERALHIGYAPQSVGPHPFTALDMVLMGRYPYLSRWQLEDAEDRRIAMEALRATETAEFADRRVDTLSGGERQRVVLARVLAQQTDVVIADEPVASLDIRHQLLAMAVLRERAARADVAVCVVMHDLNLAARFCDSILVMQEGRAIACGPPGEVFTPELIREVFGVDAQVHHRAGSGSSEDDAPVRIDVVGPSPALI